jgi:hypothetical protein
MSLLETYLEFLREEGFRPDVDDDGDIAFKFEGRRFYIVISENDPSYFHLLFPNVWKIESAEELSQALLHANDVSRSMKVVKLHVNAQRTYINAAAEMLYSEIAHLQPHFLRTLSMLQSAAREFADSMRKSNQPTSDNLSNGMVQE